jgi:hypothetical protein
LSAFGYTTVLSLYTLPKYQTKGEIMIEKPPLKLLDDPTLFVGPYAWALLGAREVWQRVYGAVVSGEDVAEVLLASWPELISFDMVSNHWIEADRAQGGIAWARRVAWWDNTAAQRQQVVDAYSDVYANAKQRLGRDKDV